MFDAVIFIPDRSLKDEFLEYSKSYGKFTSLHDKAPEFSTLQHGVLYKGAETAGEILEVLLDFYTAGSLTGHFFISLSREEQIQVPSDCKAREVTKATPQLGRLDMFQILLTADPPREGIPGIRIIKLFQSRPDGAAREEAQGTREDLVRTISETEKPSLKMKLHKEDSAPEYSSLISHFGGYPYFEEGEEWPVGKDGNPFSFIFQFFVTEEMRLPAHFALVQFYFSWKELPWCGSDEGWLVKTYKTINKDKIKIIETPYTEYRTDYCTISYEGIRTLPPIDYFSMYDKDTEKLINQLCIHSKYRNSYGFYSEIKEEIMGKQMSCSRIGGYADLMQGGAAPLGTDDKPMKLLFQLDSERCLPDCFGDAGSVYVYYDENDSSQLEYFLQCG